MGQGSGWPANSVNSFWKCFSSGSYTFTITDAYGDGICCTYGNGGYSVKVNDKEVASGGQFGSEETKTFDVGASPPTTPAPVSPSPTSAPFPAPSSPVSPPTTSAPNPAPSSPVSPPTTSAPIPAPSSPTSAPYNGVPTFYPTHTPPTPYPTEVPPTPQPSVTPPTSFPTGVAPTQFPTGTAPTPYPTHTAPTLNPGGGNNAMKEPEKPVCTPLWNACEVWSDCCSQKCHWKRKKCVPPKKNK